MAAPIDFYFDFSSPYAYLASHLIEDMAAKHGRSVVWRPMLLGAALKVTGSPPIVKVPLKGDYAGHDLKRKARLHEIPFAMPPVFPIASHAPSRGFYWLKRHDGDLAVAYAKAAWKAFFVDGTDISDKDAAADIFATVDQALFALEKPLSREAFRESIDDEVVKGFLREATDRAIERGVFGAPFIIVDGEPFWGVESLPMVDTWLERGGW